MNITIVGGGNIGTQFAVHCAEKKHCVTVFTSCPELFDRELIIVNEKGVPTNQGEICLATSDPDLAFGNAELIIITLPATMMDVIADTIYHYASSDSMIGVVPGNGGSECAFRKCIERGNVFFGIERVPAIARLVEKGKIVKSTGYREELHVASLPHSFANQCAQIVESIFGIKCVTIPNYLNLTLTPSNPILHTTRLRTIFRDWYNGVFYENVPLFYEEWDDLSSELLIACDEEVQIICRSMDSYNLKYVKSLREHYESPSVTMMTEKISSIKAFKGLTTPVIQTACGLIPDLHSRYFTADFSYGLTIIQQVGKLAGVKTPNIDETMKWYKNIAIEKDEFRFEDYGIKERTEFDLLYSK